jgi:acyl dehydratase
MRSSQPPAPCRPSRADEREPAGHSAVKPTASAAVRHQPEPKGAAQHGRRPPGSPVPVTREGHEMRERYLEDFVVRQVFGSGRLVVDEERIKSFAAEFDPQPFHLDERAAEDTIFRGLAASGWHTAAMTMRLLVDSEMKPAGGIVGAGFDEFRWPRPVRPGDELRLESEVLEVRPSKSRPEQGWIKVRTITLNQDADAVQILIANLVVPRRPA